MKRTFRTLGAIVTMGTMVTGAYLFGTTQATAVAADQTATKTKIVEVIPDGYINTGSDSFHDNYIDMREVVGFTAGDGRLQIYLADGSGYYWER